MTTEHRPQLPAVEVGDLTISANSRDLRRDLHVYAAYLQEHPIKRSYRGNDLPAADRKRLSRLIPFDGPDDLPGPVAVNAYSYAIREQEDWLAYVDWVAHRLGFVSYDTKGSWAGRSSEYRTYPDNQMQFQADRYRAFLEQPVGVQERTLRETLVNAYSHYENEFCQIAVRGRLDRFTTIDSTSGIMPKLRFDRARAALFTMLANCPIGVWHATADFVAALKAQQPYFLIPDLPQRQVPAPAKRLKLQLQPAPARYSRYANFVEGSGYPYRAVPEDAPDAFERVEGRFIERFLEGIPLALGYVEVAYAGDAPKEPRPTLGCLRAFRLTDRFRMAMEDQIPEPRVLVQPTFEVLVESPFYPASAIRHLAPLADLVREDTTTVQLQLQQKKVAAHLAAHPDVDPVALLTRLSGRALPQNVAAELKEWAGRAEIFTLYDGFGVVETHQSTTLLDAHAAEDIGPALRLVRDPHKLYEALTASGTVAQYIKHADARWTPVPPGAASVFPSVAVRPEAPPPPVESAIKQVSLVELQFADDGLFEAVRSLLIDARCLVALDPARRALTIARKDEAAIAAAVEALRDRYTIRIEEET